MNSLYRIQCAVDLSDASLAAFEYGLVGKRLTLLHVLRRNPFLLARRPWNFVHTDAWPRIHQIVSSLSPDVRVKVHARLSEGRVATEILRVAAETRADLIVVGVPARHGVYKWFGSTAARILRTSKVPVLAVPELARVRTSEETHCHGLIYGDRVTKTALSQSGLSWSPVLSLRVDQHEQDGPTPKGSL